MARKDIIMLSQKELKRLHIIQKVLEDVIKRRLYGMLQRRGFAPDVIKAAVSSAMK